MAKKQKKLLDNKDIKKYEKRIREIIRDTIKKKQRDADGKVLERRTGNLRGRINPTITIDGNDLVLNVEVMEYYKYLDEGTKFIKKWDLTDAFLDSKEFDKIMDDLYNKGIDAGFDVVFDYIEKEQ
jgi:hypothetical protein